MSKNILPMFSFGSVMVSGLTFRSLVNFEFIFIHGVRKCSNFILLDVVVQYSKHCLFKRLYSCLLCCELIDHKCVGLFIYFWALYSCPLIDVFIFLPVSYCFNCCSSMADLEVVNISPTFFFSFSNYVDYSGSFAWYKFCSVCQYPQNN